MNGNAINQVLLNLPQSGNAATKQAGSRGSATADFAQTFQDARKAQVKPEKANAQAVKRPANAAHPQNDQARDIHQAERAGHKKAEKMSPGENAVRSKSDNRRPDRADESGRQVAKMDQQNQSSSDPEHVSLSKPQTESTEESTTKSTTETNAERTAETNAESTAETNAESTAETNAESTTESTGESQAKQVNNEESPIAVIDTSNLNTPAATAPLNTTLSGLGQPLVSVQPDGAIADADDVGSLLMEQGPGGEAGIAMTGPGFDGVAGNSAETSLAGSADNKAGKTGLDNSADTTASPLLSAQSAAANILSEIKAAVSAPGDATAVEPGTVTEALTGTLAAATILSPGQATLTATAEAADQADNLLAQVASTLKTDDQAPASAGAKEALRSLTGGSTDLPASGSEQAGYEKTGFDKMLKTVTQSSLAEAAPRDQSTTQAAPATSVLDHLARVPESQGASTLRNFVVQTNVNVPVGQPQWSQAVGEKVLWLAAQNISSAELNLNPLDLGPVQVKVSVNQDQANVTFTSHHPVVREVIDQNLNRLRDMFSEQGLNLVNVDVSDKSFQRHQGESKDQQGQGGKANPDTEEEAVAAVSFIKPQRLVDHYA
jgi:flagellar hook-length control protein FliK